MTASTTPTAPDEIPSDTTLTVRADALHGLLVDLERTMSEDDTVPTIMGVMLHTRSSEPMEGNRLYATSTDRFIMAQGWESVGGALPPVLLDAEALDLAKKLLFVAGDRTVTLRLDLPLSLTLHLDDQAVLSLRTEPPQFPDLERLVTAVAPQGSTGNARLAPNYLYTLAEIGERRKAVPLFAFGEIDRPSSIQIGPQYRALLMPVKQDHDPEPFQHHFPAASNA